MSKLHPENFIRVEGVITNEWIPFLKAYGPLRRCSIKVKDILNLLNNNINVILSEEKNKELYLFTKEWNAYADISNKPKALRAEKILYQRVYKEAINLQKEDDKENPFVEDPNEAAALETAVTMIKSTPVKNKMNSIINMKQRNVDPKAMKPKMYDMLAVKDKNLTQIQRNDMILDQMQCADMEFED